MNSQFKSGARPGLRNSNGGFSPNAPINRRLRLLVLAFRLIATLASLQLSAAESGKPIWGGYVETNFPFFSSVLDARKVKSADRAAMAFPTNNLTPRGIILNLGNDAWACFDTDLLRVSAIWTGKGVTPVSMAQISYHVSGQKVNDGQGTLPQMDGKPIVVNGIYPGWQIGDKFSPVDPRDPGRDPREVGRGPLPPAMGRFKAIRLTKDGARLEYEAFGAAITEWIESRPHAGEAGPEIQLRFRLDKVPKEMIVVMAQEPLGSSWALVGSKVNGKLAAETVDEVLAGQHEVYSTIHVHPSSGPVEFRFYRVLDGSTQGWTAPASAEKPPAARWPQTVTTSGTLSASTNAYVLDQIGIPSQNPWKRNVRFADLTFFKDGRAAAITFDGDVWMISNLSGDLKNIKWRRYASGFNEPLGICTRKEELFVFDKNGIWRLRDTDGNGEADVHELFSNNFTQTAETREYVQSIRCAPDGSFIIAKGGIQSSTLGKDNGTVLRISADGKDTTVLGWGFRSPFASVHPKTGLVMASDQQGNYVPATPLHIVRDNQYYGFLSSLQPKEQYPSSIADPLTWIPHPINASGISQVWLTDAKMGPLNDALIHIGYYRPELFLVLLNNRMPRQQAAVVSLARSDEFGFLNGAVNPVDGQLYVIGFQIWGTVANQVSGLARLRYTGLPSTLPREVVPMDKGVLLRFDVPLDAGKSVDPSSYSIERWNYVRSYNYGSAHYKPDGKPGQEWMGASSAYLSKDRKSVFIGIADMKPVNQMRVGWAIASAAGQSFGQNAYFTPYEFAHFDPQAEGFDAITVDLTPRALAKQAATPVTIEEGKRISELMGCIACHSSDGSTLAKIGPTWKGLYGSEVAFADKTKAIADDEYLRESIIEPAAKIVKGYEKSEAGMPSYSGVITDSQIEALILYIKSLR